MKKKEITKLQAKTLSFEEKREIAKNEEKNLEKQIQDLRKWVLSTSHFNLFLPHFLIFLYFYFCI